MVPRNEFATARRRALPPPMVVAFFVEIKKMVDLTATCNTYKQNLPSAVKSTIATLRYDDGVRLQGGLPEEASVQMGNSLPAVTLGGTNELRCCNTWLRQNDDIGRKPLCQMTRSFRSHRRIVHYRASSESQYPYKRRPPPRVVGHLRRCRQSHPRRVRRRQHRGRRDIGRGHRGADASTRAMTFAARR